MDSGIATVIGAIVGGGASLAGTALTQHGQRTKEAETRRAEVNERALTAARIALGDLVWDRDHVKDAKRRQVYWSEREELISESWEHCRETLAVVLRSDDDWWTVFDAFRAVRALRRHADKQRRNLSQEEPPFDDWATKHVDNRLGDINDAVAVLEPLAGRTAEKIEEVN